MPNLEKVHSAGRTDQSKAGEESGRERNYEP